MKTTSLLRCILVMIMVCSAIHVHAQTLVIVQHDDSKVFYNLDEEPLTTFTPDDLVIKTQSTTISYPLNTIKQFMYEKGVTGVEEVSRDGVCISQKDDQIIVTGLPIGKSVSLYSTDGYQIAKQVSDGSQRTILSLSQLPAGVYIVKADNVTYKTTKR